MRRIIIFNFHSCTARVAGVRIRTNEKEFVGMLCFVDIILGFKCVFDIRSGVFYFREIIYIIGDTPTPNRTSPRAAVAAPVLKPVGE